MYKIGHFAKLIGVSIRTLRYWDKINILKPIKVTKGGTRFYSDAKLKKYLGESEDTNIKKNYVYARVSNQNQKDDLENQIEFLKTFCNARGHIVEYLSDIGSGLNYKRKNWNKLLEEVMKGNVDKIFITYKDRFVRFGYDWFETLCKNNGAEIVVLNDVKSSPEKELVDDLISIVHVFSSRIYGLRKYRKVIKNDKSL